MTRIRFEWDESKDRLNQKKHGIAFSDAQVAFADPHRIILEDMDHSQHENRFYCLGEVAGGILTV